MCKYSQLHTNASLTTSTTTTNTNTTITLQHDSTQPRQRVGSLLQGHLGLGGTQVGPGRTPTVHRCPKEKAVGGHNRRPWTKNVRQRQALRQTCLQETSADRRAVNEDKTLVNLHGSGACATITRRSRSERIDMISTCQQNRSRGVPDHQEDRAEKWNDHPSETEYIKIPPKPYTDKVTDVTVAIQKQFHQTQTTHGKSRTKGLNK